MKVPLKNSLIICYITSIFLISSCAKQSAPSSISETKQSNGLTIFYCGELNAPPNDPSVYWVYRNASNKRIFIFTGASWMLMNDDGTNDANGTVASNGVTVFIAFNDSRSAATPSTPAGDGTSPSGWHTDHTDSVAWISQKITDGISPGSWGTPIYIYNPSGGTGKWNDHGFVYNEGFKEGLLCGQCHSSAEESGDRVITKIIQYQLSMHSQFGNYDRNTPQCAGCHTNEGFFERYQNGFINETYFPSISSGPITTQSYLNASPVGCFTCHSPHKNGDFSIRDSSVIKIFSIVAGQSTKELVLTGASNLCVKCHQPRMTSTFLIPGSVPVSFQPDPAKNSTADTAKIYTTRWNNHGSGEQTQSLLGFGGFEWPGYTYSQSYHKIAFESRNLGCENCHMSTPLENKSGDHTFSIGYLPSGSLTTAYNVSGCNSIQCHGTNGISLSSPQWKNIREEISAKISQLGKMLSDTNVTRKFSLPQNGKAVSWASYSVTGIDTTWTVANASSTKPLIIVPASKSGALWNLQFVQSDKSRGIHNSKYLRALLDASIAELKK